MKENTNRAIAYNSIILYGKMIVTTICSLLTTRFALKALGVVDFGLFSVLGGIISFIAIFNIIMLSSSNRFIAIAIGKGRIEEVNKQFNVNLTIHIFIALIALLIAYPLGCWYIPRYVNYDGTLNNAMMVYFVSITGSVLSFISVPYHGLLMAKERFFVFSLVDIFTHIVRLIVAWLLLYMFYNKLLIYTITMAVMTAIPTLIYYCYCKHSFPEMVRVCFVKDKKMYKDIFGFSSWVGVGAISQVGRDQGASLIVNLFFNTAMNTAMGIATSINSYVSLFAQNVTMPMAPQITKSYSAGNILRTEELLIMSTKYSFLLMFLIGSFFLVEPEWLLSLWLGEVPLYTAIFLVLLVINNLVQSFNSGIGNLVFASGKIKLYQVVVSSSNILSVVVGYLVLRGGAEAYCLVVAYIFVSFVRFIGVQWSLYRAVQFNGKVLWRFSYFPSMLVVILFIPVFFLPDYIHPILHLSVSFVYLCFIEWFVGLNKNERKRILFFVCEHYKSRK